MILRPARDRRCNRSALRSNTYDAYNPGVQINAAGNVLQTVDQTGVIQTSGVTPSTNYAAPRRLFPENRQKENRNVAIVAVARKLVTIAWHMLTNNEPYRYAVPGTLDAKFARLRILATGEKNKRGSSKGTPRSANYGTGVRTRAVPALADIYVREGLPPIVPLEDNPAELRALQRHEPSVLRHAQQVSVAKRVPRRRGSTLAVPAKEGAANKQ